jgi:Zn-dependent protease with chaperone function
MSDVVEIQKEVDKSRKRRLEFIDRVRKEEQHANRDPQGYRRKVYALVALAYGYIFAILALAIGMLAVVVYAVLEAGRGNTVLLRLAIIFGLLTYAILRSLWVKIAPPKGAVLKREDAPELYRLVDDIADRLQAPRPDEIRLDFRLNAAASQTPRFGMFGSYRNVLLLGMPLLLALSPDEARAVIAHEFGHFSGAHGKFGAWAYRVEMTWRQLWQQLSRTNSWGSLLFIPFVRWFQPRFSATTFALRRANEYEADKAAAEIAGADNIARGLMRFQYLNPHLQKNFWGRLTDRAKESPLPPANAFMEMPQALREAPAPDLIRRNLKIALAKKTDYDDTHPCLTDRLSALGQLPGSLEDTVLELDQPITTSAGEAFLGSRLPGLIARVESEYATEVREQWQKQHAKHAQRVELLRELEAAAQSMPLTEKENVDRAFYIYKIEGTEKGEQLFRQLRQEYPMNPQVAFVLGSILAEKEDLEAVPLLQEAIHAYPTGATAALNVLATLYRVHGMQDEVDALRDQARDTQRSRELIDSHGRTVNITDQFEAHDLSAHQVAKLVERLPQFPVLGTAYLVNKVLPNGERRLVLVALHRQRFLESGHEPTKLTQALVKGLAIPDFVRVTVFCPSKERKAWERCLSGIPRALIYRQAPDR